MTSYDRDALDLLLARIYGARLRRIDSISASEPYVRLGGRRLPGAQEALAEARAADAALETLRVELDALLGDVSTEW